MMELTGQPWESIMMMPYNFFISSLKWKIKLEDEKRKKLEEKSTKSSHKNKKLRFK